MLLKLGRGASFEMNFQIGLGLRRPNQRVHPTIKFPVGHGIDPSIRGPKNLAAAEHIVRISHAEPKFSLAKVV
jgi:hypothetical protein